MAYDHESSSSVVEKLILIMFIAAIIIGNVSFNCLSKLIFIVEEKI